MATRLENILEQFVAVAQPEILVDHLPQSCIASTWIATQVFQRLGFTAHPLEVRLSVGNAAYRRLRDQFGPPKAYDQLDQWSRQYGAYVVGIGFDDRPTITGGHLVAIVNNSFLVDASIDQAAAPCYNLNVPPVLCGPVDPLFVSGAKRLQRLDVLDLFIEYSQPPAAWCYKESFDWGHNPETDSAVSRILTTINEK